MYRQDITMLEDMMTNSKHNQVKSSKLGGCNLGAVAMVLIAGSINNGHARYSIYVASVCVHHVYNIALFIVSSF